MRASDLPSSEIIGPLDPGFAKPKAVALLERPENRRLLDHVATDAFGAHVFPGDLLDYPAARFLEELNRQLQDGNPIHLWVNLPVCEQRCHFCQFPVVTARPADLRAGVLQRWLDANLKEVRLWLDAVPALGRVPIGAFSILGGTPTLLSDAQLGALLHSYRERFHFREETSIRIEGTASTFTADRLAQLKGLGIRTVSAGVQAFDDAVLAAAHCIHTAADGRNYLEQARLRFDVDLDLMYGMAGQEVRGFLEDVGYALAHGVTCLVLTKLHLRTFAEPRSAVSGEKPAAWQSPRVRRKLEERGRRWPSLGEQYQMREEAAGMLSRSRYQEHPTMYFHHPERPPSKWKALTVDPDKQFAEVGFGMGGSSSSMRAEAINATTEGGYFGLLDQGRIPLGSVRGFTGHGLLKKAIKMALTSCRPLEDCLFRERHPGQSLFQAPWKPLFEGLERRALVAIDGPGRRIALTEVGRTLVEAIIHTEFEREG
ncbi:MAG: radical SAM protein [Holophaga sp.]|nr:radical SAM protein [Holophaga sp.]